MTRPSSPSLIAATGLAALMGGMVWALLAALLGLTHRRAGERARDVARPGMTVVVLQAEATAAFEYEEYVEWVAVPTPWRNGRLFPLRHARALSVALPCRFRRLGAFGRGPPGVISGLDCG